MRTRTWLITGASAGLGGHCGTRSSRSMSPGDPVLAAHAIYDALAAEEVPHRIIPGPDAYDRFGRKLDDLQADYRAGRQVALSTDFAA